MAAPRMTEKDSYGGDTLTPNTPATTLQKSGFSPDPQEPHQLPAPATQSTSGQRRRRRGPGRALRFSFKSEWTRLRTVWRNLGPSAFSLGTENEDALKSETDLSGIYLGNESDEVDEVIVDRLWGEDARTGDTPTDGDGAAGEKRAPPGADNNAADQDERRTENGDRRAMLAPLKFLQSRVLANIYNFFSPRFGNELLEAQYRQETWIVSKPLAALATCFFIINWVLSLSFAKGHLVLADKIWYYAVAPVLILPLPVMVIRFDLPRTRPLFYQTFVTFSAWGWALYSLIFIDLCGYYNPSHQLWDCGTKDQQDFMALFYFGCAFPVIGLFGLRLNRFPSIIGTIAFTVLACVFIVPELVTFTRNVLNFAIFHAFLLYVHYVKEKSERRLFFLRDKLAVQYKETRAAQLGERKTAESKRRLTSYVFHEVRVPLNTAVLAAQNLDASGTIQKSQKIEFRALSGSLAQMSAVLNDILDFNRMDSGRFEFVARPYAFHQVLRSIFVPLRMSTDARKLHFVTDLDHEIDLLARRAALEAQDKGEHDIARDLLENPDEPGVVVGDEMRLRQVITNLASNACKFTQPGGELRITTRLLPFGSGSGAPAASEPPPSPNPNAPAPAPAAAANGAALGDPLSVAHLKEHDREDDCPQGKWIAVRIEVTDTGCGIAPKDMHESKLFSPFNQTEQGRQQGGKGTGLGLAIVRQIVNLSGGRLGVKSKVGEGTTFWVEIPLGIGKRAVVPSRRATTNFDETDTPLRPYNRMWPNNRTGIPTSPRPSLRGVLEDGRADPMLSQAVNDAGDSSQLMSLARQESARSKASLDEEPMMMAPPMLSQDPSQYNADPWSPGLKILVVDDDPLTRTLMKRMMTRLGCHVTTAENGQLALDAISSSTAPLPTPSTFTEESSYGLETRAPSLSNGDLKFALIFLDNQMPVMSGLQAVRKLRAQGGRDFVVGVTGNALLTDQQEFLQAGADHVLTKPVYERDLKRMLTIADKRRKESLMAHMP